ncbi:MAG: 30S ribosomal protein S4 [Candidatus Levybacteria bacterium]|nr:30S ribosomal protein S4 [Candidatus Levybacteria bacterium]
MARYTGPKHKLARREGVNILEKSSGSLERRLNILPGVQSRRGGRRKPSEYGLQLREKQQLKRSYGLLEKQFRKYVEMAQKSQENTDEMLIQLLEGRLDNVVYRLGFANSRNMARQFVSHGHVLVDDSKVSIPSYNVKIGQRVSLSPKLLKNEILKLHVEETASNLLPFLERKGTIGRLSRKPTRDEVPNPADYQLVIEFYSR